eukprot:CAMPEP_0181048432 /NCGR_PEP_ID=MMETSP1070-20121207/15431_1 /TAXON_ID=265543 /ORGANISM="Minutocellus polymorphus, Strain NH13" /LENGTH=255 /DNA_ID=CAMNT_0023127213 /DNA_START=131 /DNA_END=898 /DNA_ORIENTATION=+
MSKIVAQAIRLSDQGRKDAEEMMKTTVSVGSCGCLVTRGHDPTSSSYNDYRTNDGKRWHTYCHRLSFNHLKQPGKLLVPGDGMQIAHTCDTRGCVQPEHLEERSVQHNWEDRAVNAFENMPDFLQYLPDRDGIANKKSHPTQALVRNHVTALEETLEDIRASLRGDPSSFTVVDGGEELDDNEREALLDKLNDLLDDPDIVSLCAQARDGGDFDLRKYQQLPDVAARKQMKSNTKKRSASAAALGDSDEDEAMEE